MIIDNFADLSRLFIGLSVSHVWRGYGSALFLEFGQLTPTVRPRGGPGDPQGEVCLMIEWSWRIEQGTTILCGSWSDEDLWAPTFAGLLGRRITDMQIFGALPEITILLDEDVRVSSYMTAEGDPQWVLFDRRNAPANSYFSKAGQIEVEQFNWP